MNPHSQFRAALFDSESSSRYDNPKNPNYYGGFQFGKARLQDYTDAMGRDPISRKELEGNPELQETIMDWHTNDILKYADTHNLMERFGGTTIGGTVITPSAIVAMAHIGGRKGMRKYLESDGKHDPDDDPDKDVVGTRLSDYAKKFSGMSMDVPPDDLNADFASTFRPDVSYAQLQGHVDKLGNAVEAAYPETSYSGIVSAAPKDANTVPQTGIMTRIGNFFGFGNDAADENASLEADAASLAEISASLAEKGISDPDGQFAGELFKARKSQESSGDNVAAVRQGLGMLASGFQGPSFQEVPQLAQVSQARGRGSDPMSNFGTKSMLG